MTERDSSNSAGSNSPNKASPFWTLAEEEDSKDISNIQDTLGQDHLGRLLSSNEDTVRIKNTIANSSDNQRNANNQQDQTSADATTTTDPLMNLFQPPLVTSSMSPRNLPRAPPLLPRKDASSAPATGRDATTTAPRQENSRKPPSNKPSSQPFGQGPQTSPTRTQATTASPLSRGGLNKLPRPTGLHTRGRSVSFGTSQHAAMSRGGGRDRSYSLGVDSVVGSQSGVLGDIWKRLEQKVPHLPSLPTSLQEHQDRPVTLDDVIGAGKYEIEAETNLLKAIEDMQYQQHQQQNAPIRRPKHHRGISDISSIFLGVPDNLAHDFSLEEEDEDDDDEVDSFIRNARVPSERSDSLNNASIVYSGGRTDGRSNNDPSLTNSASIENHALHEDPEAQTKPLISKPPRRRHRRTMSVEDKLTGLSRAMMEMGDENTLSPQSRVPMSDSDATTQGTVKKARQKLNVDQPPQDAPSSIDSRGQRLEVIQSPLSIDSLQNDSDGQMSYIETSSAVHQGSKQNDKKSPPLSPNSSSEHPFANDTLRDEFSLWNNFFRPRAKSIAKYLRRVILYIILPLVGTAALLFYYFDNPLAGTGQESDASISWWLLFVARQCLTFSLALVVQAIVIDILGVGTKVILRMMGPFITLLIVQSKGWPFITFCWAIINFGLLYGKHPFAHNWGYFQDAIGLFNADNPSGDVVENEWNRRALLIGVFVSLFVALKRFLVGLVLGRQTFYHYGAQLCAVMDKMVLVGEVAQLSKRFQRIAIHPTGNKNEIAALKQETEHLRGLQIDHVEESAAGDSESANSTLKSVITGEVIDVTKRDPLTGHLHPTERAKLLTLVGSWEEPDRKTAATTQSVSISGVLKFRKALTFIRNDFPFSYAFGLADSRENCIDSAQRVFKLLMVGTPDGVGEQVISIETLALVALFPDGSIDQDKAKMLVKIFRPDRSGSVDLLNFVKSIDAVYKEFRLLQASIGNSSQIDRAFENLLNIIFYTVVTTIILSQIGFDPLALFLSLSSVILAFAFMIGPASSKYFEGLLFILVRRPYGIGDLIHISNVENDTDIDGSTGWFVQNVTLYETTVTWLATMETASLSNGSLANSRIINWARSPNARCVILFSIPIDTKYETLELYKKAIEEYVKVRPREWIAFNAFRIFALFAEHGYMRLEVVVQHRDSWQSQQQVKESKGNLISFCQEVQKLLGMEYRAPPVPINLTQQHYGQIPMGDAGLNPTTNVVDDPALDSEQYDTFANIPPASEGTWLKTNIPPASEGMEAFQIEDPHHGPDPTAMDAPFFRTVAESRHRISLNTNQQNRASY